MLPEYAYFMLLVHCSLLLLFYSCSHSKHSEYTCMQNSYRIFQMNRLSVRCEYLSFSQLFLF